MNTSEIKLGQKEERVAKHEQKGAERESGLGLHGFNADLSTQINRATRENSRKRAPCK